MLGAVLIVPDCTPVDRRAGTGVFDQDRTVGGAGRVPVAEADQRVRSAEAPGPGDGAHAHVHLVEVQDTSEEARHVAIQRAFSRPGRSCERPGEWGIADLDVHVTGGVVRGAHAVQVVEAADGRQRAGGWVKREPVVRERLHPAGNSLLHRVGVDGTGQTGVIHAGGCNLDGHVEIGLQTAALGIHVAAVDGQSAHAEECGQEQRDRRQDLAGRRMPPMHIRASTSIHLTRRLTRATSRWCPSTGS